MPKDKKYKRIIITDLRTDGHWTTYMRVFTKTFLELGYQVVVLFPNPLAVKVWVDKNCEKFAQNVTYFEIKPFHQKPPGITRLKPLFIFRLFLFRELYSQINEHLTQSELKDSLVFIAWYSYYTMHTPPVLSRFEKLVFAIQRTVMNRIFPVSWFTLIYHYGISMQQQSGVMGSKFFKASCVFVNANKKYTGRAINKPIHAIPDFSEQITGWNETLISQEIINRAGTRKIIGLAGEISQRKGATYFMEVTKQADPDKYFFVLAGKPDWSSFDPKEQSEMRRLLKKENCFSHLDFIPGEEAFCSIISTFDIIHATYFEHKGTSGMHFKSSFLKVPVIVSKGTIMEELTNEYKLGLAVEYGNVSEYLLAIKKLISKENEPYGFDRYYQDNHPDKLMEVMSTMLNEIENKKGPWLN